MIRSRLRYNPDILHHLMHQPNGRERAIKYLREFGGVTQKRANELLDVWTGRYNRMHSKK